MNGLAGEASHSCELLGRQNRQGDPEFPKSLLVLISSSAAKKFPNFLGLSSLDLLQVWDTVERSCVHTFSHHTGKVQAVAWNPAEPAVLLSAGEFAAESVSSRELFCCGSGRPLLGGRLVVKSEFEMLASAAFVEKVSARTVCQQSTRLWPKSLTAVPLLLP